MATSVTSKGQVTIPKKVRDHLRIKPGTKVVFEMAEDGAVYLAPETAKSKVSKVDRARERRIQRFMEHLKTLEGTASAGLSTDEIMRMTRGED